MASEPSTAAELLELLQAERDKLSEALLAKNTRKGYHYAWQSFAKFCSQFERSPLPATPETVSLYTVELLHQGRKVTTVHHRLAAIARKHRDANHACPVTSEVKGLLLGARRLRIEQTRQVLPLTLDQVRAISTALLSDDTPLSIRDRAIVLVGFASALRASNLAGLLLEDASFLEQGVVLKIRRSKTDQAGKGNVVGVPRGKHHETCPVKGLESWISRRGSFPGPLFCRLDWHQGCKPIEPERVCQIVQRAVARIGLDPRGYGAHSLRAGFVTEAGEAGAGEMQIASQTGHKDLSVLRQYFRRQDVFRSNPAAMLDL